MASSLQSLPPIPTWTPLFSKENLERKVGTREFDRGFRLVAISDGELGFPSFPTCFQEDFVLDELVRRRLPVYIGVDLSSSTRPGNAIVAVALDPRSQKRYVVDVRYGAWTSPETAKEITDVFGGHAVDRVMVENNAYQGSIIEWTQDNRERFPWWTKVDAYTTGRGKADPQYGLPGLEVQFKNRAWVIASAKWYGHLSTCKCAWCEWRRQIAIYPRGTATDFVMATWFADIAITKWGRVHGNVVGNLSGLNNR